MKNALLPIKPDDVFTIKTLAEALLVSKETVSRWVNGYKFKRKDGKKKKVPPVLEAERLGARCVRIAGQAVLNFLGGKKGGAK
jgi:hypothetical protein